MIDTNALLSGSGSGEFVLEHIEGQSVPASKELRAMHPFLETDLAHSKDWDIMGPTFDFLREITIQAAKIGELCVKIRDTFKGQNRPPTRVQIAQFQQKVTQARGILWKRWNSQVPAPLGAALGQQRLSGNARDAYEHVSSELSQL